MYALNFDSLKRTMKTLGVDLRKIDTVFEGTPEFEALWNLYSGPNAHENLHLCTEDDNRTHTFYFLHNNNNNTVDNTEKEVSK